MEFEKAAELRDRILLLKDMDLGLKPPSRALLKAPAQAGRREEARHAGSAVASAARQGRRDDDKSR